LRKEYGLDKGKTNYNASVDLKTKAMLEALAKVMGFRSQRELQEEFLKMIAITKPDEFKQAEIMAKKFELEMKQKVKN
jgi:hypothetical protein